jgi:hypothetical protein
MVLSPDERRITLAQGREPDESHGVNWECSASFGADFASGDQRMVLAANAEYVEQAVRALALAPDRPVEIAANGPMMGFMLRPADEHGVFVVTMPMSRPTDSAQAGE